MRFPGRACFRSARLVAAAAALLPGATAGLRAQTAGADPIRVSLAEAIRRAQANEPTFAAAAGLEKTEALNRSIARAALLPTVVYHNQYLFTQANGVHNEGAAPGLQSSPIFIANNAVHEYTSQASIGETIGWKQIADAQLAAANAARARAELEIARRGLVAAVVSLYYQVADTEAKRQLAAGGLKEAAAFSALTEKRETAREVAHADVVKARLLELQRQRDLSDAQLMAERARLELGVLLFADPRTPYSTDAPPAPAALPTRAEVSELASANSPEIRSALAGLRAGDAAVASARAAYLPDLGVNFSYGIDAPQFAKRGPGPDFAKNLGYSASATVDVPIWDWLSTRRRVQQSQIERHVARVALTAAERRLLANLDAVYAEAEAAQAQLSMLEEGTRMGAESLRLTKLRYAAGEATALEVVDAQNSYLSAETAQADGLARYQSSLAALNLLTGAL